MKNTESFINKLILAAYLFFLLTASRAESFEGAIELQIPNATTFKKELFDYSKFENIISTSSGSADIVISEIEPSKEKNWFPWDPTGLNNYPASKECRQETLRELIWRDTVVAAQGRAINKWLERCHDEFKRPFAKHSFIPLIKYMMMNYDFNSNRNFRTIKATLPDGRILTGIIAMKGDGKPRPLVIAKCGLFCNAEQSVVHRSFLMHLFDESPFHVLALANNTGTEFQINNKAFSVGGFDEGRQLYQIAQIVRAPNSPIRHIISSVHVAGASLGGNAALYAGLYSSANDLPGQELVQSVTAICPVVAVESSVKRLYTSNPFSPLTRRETIHALREAFNFVPVISKIFPLNLKELKGAALYKKLSQAALAYYQDWTQKRPWDLKPFEGVRITTLPQFWELNDFSNFVSLVTTPTLAIAAENDDVIKIDDNAKLLSQKYQHSPNKAVDTVFFKQGNHCAFATANGWGNYSTLLREYILSHSPEALQHWQNRRLPLHGVNLRLAQNETIVETEWVARTGKSDLLLKLKIYSKHFSMENPNCFGDNPLRAPDACYREERIVVPFKDLPLETTEAPQNKYEVTSLTRWANTRLSVLDKDGELVVNSAHQPQYVQAWVWNP